MRVWDQIPPYRLCRQHLLGEHREIHSIWTALTKPGAGYQNHPEVRRWREFKPGLLRRHALLVDEMKARGYNHRTPILVPIVTGRVGYPPPLDDQPAKLAAKNCECDTHA